MKLALHIIAKGQVEEVKNIIKLYGQYFDEICIAPDERIEEFLSIGDEKVKIFPYKWQDNFSHKRNFLVEKIQSEYYFRLDTDDLIKNPESIRILFDKAVKFDIDVILLNYIYSKDIDGNCIASHWRETIIKKSDRCKWNKTIHENILFNEGIESKVVKDSSIDIIHNIDESHSVESWQRNFSYLIKEFNQDKENTDPRTLAYIGRMLMGMGKWKECIPFLQLLIEKSGWDDDKYYAFINLAQCFNMLNNYEQAIACCNEAMAINTDFPDSYLQLCEIYIAKGDHKKAIHWGKIGISKKIPETLFVIDPSVYKHRAAMNLAIAYLGIGDIDTAKSCYDTAYKLAPHDDFVSKHKGLFDEAKENTDYLNHFREIVNFVLKKDDKKIIKLVESIPSCMMKDERIHALRNNYLPSKQWAENEIVIFCGMAWEEWAPVSIVNGIGGSEEAVIYLSKELTKLGWKVTVFNDCGELNGVYNSVEYKPYFEFNPNDKYNIIISWRNNIFNSLIKAKKKFVWLHDVPLNGQYDNYTDYDKIIVLSQFHKSLLSKNIPEERVFVSRNGINLDDFNDKNIIQDGYRMIYTSSYDRGLEHLLRMWPDIIKEVPKANLVICYGWNTYDKMVLEGRRDPKFKEYMVNLMNQPGIKELGRIGHRKLVQQLKEARFFVYPSHFEEISCISAMKAQAAGCIPVCTNYAALKETVKDGVIVDGKCGDNNTNEKFKQALIFALKNPKQVNIDKEQFGWDKVAEEWDKELFKI